MKHTHRVLSYVVIVILLIIITISSLYLPGLRKFSSPIYVRDLLLSLGGWGYIVFVILLLLSIPLPLPSTPIAIAGGYVYGFTLGTILAMVGTILGSLISFYLVRWLGKQFLEKLVSKHHIIHLNHIFKKRGISAVLISYAIPLFPNDAISLILGLTPMPVGTFLWVLVIGNIPRYLITSSLGQDMYTGFTLRTIITLLLAAVFIVVALFRERFKRIFFTEIREVEKEVAVVEKDMGMKGKIIQKKKKIKK